MPEIVVKKVSYSTFIVLMIIIDVLSLIANVLFQSVNFGNRLAIIQSFYPGFDLPFIGTFIALAEAITYGIIDGVIITLVYNKIVAKKFPLKLKY